MRPARLGRRAPLTPEGLHDRITQTEDAIALCHLGISRMTREEWELTADGLVESPLTLRFDGAVQPAFGHRNALPVGQCPDCMNRAHHPRRRDLVGLGQAVAAGLDVRGTRQRAKDLPP